MKMARARALTRNGYFLFAVVILWSAVGLFIGVNPAHAHDQLLKSTPAANAALASSPSEITLEFSDAVLTIGPVVILVDKNDRNWIDEEPILDGSTVTALVNGVLPDGEYETRWRVVSVDGHPISGIIPFTVGDVEPTQSDSPSDSADISQSSTPGPIVASNSGDSLARPVFVGVGGGAAALLLFWVTTAWIRRRRHHSKSGATST